MSSSMGNARIAAKILRFPSSNFTTKRGGGLTVVSVMIFALAVFAINAIRTRIGTGNPNSSETKRKR